MFGYYVMLIVSWLITIAIAFYVIRAATRSDEQVSLLKKIIEGQERIINGSAQKTYEKEEVKAEPSKPEAAGKSDEDYLLEARKKAGLI
ncbi:YebO family protein [Cronobacter dublinensis]